MTYASLEHFRDVTSRNVLALQEAREKGRKVVGQFCIYSPLEIALAAGAVPVSLCGTKQDSIPVAEEVLPRCLCPLIKSSFGFALQDSCPYLAASDIVVADATCDGKKKMYELLAAYKPVMVLQLPQIQDERAHAYWREQYALLVARLEQDFGVRITEEKLRAAMDLTSRLRQALKKVLDLARRYLDMHCAVMSPNPHRYSILKDLARDFAVDAVVDLTWQGCQPYDVESWSVKKFVREELGLPFLQVVTDYSGTDTEQLKVRLEAFLEMLA